MANPVDVSVKGLALVSNGFTAKNTYNGVGLVTFGFLWSCDGIWANADDPITTTWASDTPASIEVCTD